MKTLKTVKDFFKKPALSFDKIVILGLCIFFLIFIDETYGKFYGMAGATIRALIVAVMLALCVQVVRLVFEIRAGK